MTVELLAIVQAEEQADALVKDAQERKELSIKQALEKRQTALSRITAPEPTQPKLKALKPDTDRFKALARKNKKKAVNAILEELHAQE